eukprot:354463-Chlamydomonas_euryale.AAC.14
MQGASVARTCNAYLVPCARTGRDGREGERYGPMAFPYSSERASEQETPMHRARPLLQRMATARQPRGDRPASAQQPTHMVSTAMVMSSSMLFAGGRRRLALPAGWLLRSARLAVPCPRCANRRTRPRCASSHTARGASR